MRRKPFAVCVLLVLGIAAWAQNGGDGWSRYSNEGGKFSVLVPAQLEEGSKTEKGVLLHTFQVVQAPRMYMVLYSDYPEADLKVETPERLKAERDGFLKGTSDGKLISEREFKFKRGSTELPALEFTSESPKAIYKVMVILDGQRVYFVGTGGLKGNDSTREFERFLGSFSLN
jgi:hypothetical protein